LVENIYSSKDVISRKKDGFPSLIIFIAIKIKIFDFLFKLSCL